MQPMNIIPFFYRASQSFPADDITITTLVTPNRLPILRKLAERYPGPLSVTLHLPLSASTTPTADLEALHARIDCHHSVAHAAHAAPADRAYPSV
ncbi:hypothetical protein EWM64_g9664 [Hericium alpestre]|uniref:Uncharacterized protein n=1 Tax=Hericium alpestre TaxID=135208 RepID=A0A4Y9ZLD9_9AGAM|nr:hypothetical protein EWM64_g9664 [Hericium alpestre]